MTILILGSADDDHAAHMRDHLSTLGADVEFLDSSRFPAELRISLSVAGEGDLTHPGGRRLAFDGITSVYWRSYAGIEPADLPDAEQAYIAANDSRALFESLLELLPCRWVNGRRAFELHQTKPVQLAMISRLGVPVPRTWWGNDPAAARRFVEQTGACIFKPVQGGAHTARVTADHLTEENLENLNLAPVTLQEEIPGTNIRVFVAGDDVLACEVATPELDFREDEEPEILPLELPGEVRAQSLAIARELDLLWTGIDFRRTDEGQHVFLEANPSPMFLGFEHRTGLPLTDALARLLIDRC